MILQDIESARERLTGVILKTPLVYSQALSRWGGREIFLKLENLQTTGSFKLRGALNRLTLLRDRGEGDRVVAASAGNHGQGVAWAATHLGLKATIVMPRGASITKQMACRGYGADLVLSGQNLSESLEKAQELVAQGFIFIHPFDDLEVVAGQGTLGLEILEDLLEVDTVVLPVGGGGLAAGTALALKERSPGVRVLGVQTAQVPSLAAALELGQPVMVPMPPTLGDGIRVGQTGRLTFPYLEKYLDDLVLVGEKDIAQAILVLLENKKVLAEGAGAVPVAALLGPLAYADLGRRVVLVISGGNIDTPLLERVLVRALLEKGRVLNLRVELSDRPGSLGRLATRLGEQEANILHLFHDRLARDLPLDSTRVEVILETRDQEHGDQVVRSLQKAGYRVEEKP
ncbi:MAG: threonine ammonia-lyase [Syntrophobacterales bacterium]|jgi:threonine dehydratase